MAVNVKAMLEYGIKKLGIVVRYEAVRKNLTYSGIKIGFKSADVTEVNNVNDYGFHAKTVTLLASQFSKVSPPEKFDRIIISDQESYVIDGVVPMYDIQGQIIGYKARVSGG